MDFVQEMGRAGQVSIPDPLRFLYTVFYLFDSFLYLYEQIMDPENLLIDKSYEEEEVHSLFEMANMLVFQLGCFYISIEKHLGKILKSL